VPYDPRDPDGFEEALAARLGELTGDPARATEMGRAGRERAIAEFGWDAIAERTVEVYRHALAHPR
jgi:starch synthase